MRSVADIVRAARDLRSRYSDRDTRYENAYHAYKGEYNQIAPGYADALQDVRRVAGDHVMVWNLILPIVDTQRMLHNRLPQIIVPPPKYEDPLAVDFAETIEKALYALWDASDMTAEHGYNSFNKSLYNCGVWFVRWDPERDIPIVQHRQPGETYPMLMRGNDMAYCIFAWEEEPDLLAERYPEAKSLFGRNEARQGKIEVMEYVDKDHYGFIVADRYKELAPEKIKTHGLGVCPVIIDPSSFVPGDLFPAGAIDQLISLNDYLNRFQTKWGDALESVMFTGTVLQGEGSEEVVWNNGPGAVNKLPEGVDYKPVQPPQLPSEIFVHLERIEALMRRISQYPESASGEIDASVVTGQAITRLQGVMTGMALESQNNTARALKRVNRLMLKMMEVIRPDKKFELYSDDDISPASSPNRDFDFAVSIIPSQHIQGYHRSKLWYSPFGSNITATLQTVMQLHNARMCSAQWAMDQIPGIGDTSGMQKQIEEEDRRRVGLEAELQAEAQIKVMQAQAQLQQMQTQMQGGAAPGGAPAEAAPAEGQPPMQGAEMVGNTLVMPGGSPQMMGMGEPVTGTEGFPLEYTPLKPFNQATDVALGKTQGAQPEMDALPGRESIAAEDVIAALSEAVNRKGERALDKLRGKVYLVGEIARRGYTDGTIDFAITVKADQQIIVNALPQYAVENKLKFTVIGENATPPNGIPINGGSNAVPENAALVA